MPSQRNQNQLKQINDHLDSASSIILIDYAGISVADQQALRSNLNQDQGSFSVSKNTLVKLALKSKSLLTPELEQVLNGPTAIVYGQEITSTAKSITEFQKNHPSLTIKAGLSLSSNQDRILSVEEIQQLSKLPSKDQLYANLLSQLNAPAQSLVRVLTAPMQNLVYLLQNVADRG